MLDIAGLTNKAKNLAKDKATNFFADQFPGLCLAEDIAPKPKLDNHPYGWMGMSQQEGLSKYQELRKSGIQHKNLYFVRLIPYKDNMTKTLPLLDNPNMVWLATEISAPIIQLDTESKKAGHHTMNHVTGSQSPEVTVTFIENDENDLMNSLKKMRRFICKNDGTQALPSEYCFWLDFWLYGRKEGLAAPKSAERFLVFISQANLELAASESDALLIPVTFTQSRRFMPF
jgi:hypothetical protein